MFTGLHNVLLYWFVLVAIHFTIIPITKISLKLPFKIWIFLYISHISALIWFAAKVSSFNEIGFASVLIIMI